MTKQTRRLIHCVPMVMMLALTLPAWGQQGQIQVLHNEYNDQVMLVNQTADKVFASAEGRKTSGADLLQAIDKLVPMVQEELTNPPEPIMAQAMKNDPQFAAGMKVQVAQQLKEYEMFRLALNEPGAVKANEDAKAKGGQTAALALVDRCAAGWLIASHDEQAAAFDKLRSVIKASGQNPPWQLWYNLWVFNPPSSEKVGTDMLAYLQSYSSTVEGKRLLSHIGPIVKRLQLDGKPLKLDGTLIAGGSFSTGNWKGKVVLIGGWYADCPGMFDSILPKIQDLLAKHRAEGLEVLALAYSSTVSNAKAPLAAHPEIKFPIMFQLAKMDQYYGCVLTGQDRFGVSASGLGMVLDRKGILHYINGQPAGVEAEIVKLLAEKP